MECVKGGSLMKFDKVSSKKLSNFIRIGVYSRNMRSQTKLTIYSILMEIMFYHIFIIASRVFMRLEVSSGYLKDQKEQELIFPHQI